MTQRILVFKAQHVAQCRLNIVHAHHLSDLLRFVLAALRPDYERCLAVYVIVEVVNGDITRIFLSQHRISEGVVVEVSLVLGGLYLCIVVTVKHEHGVIQQTLAVKVGEELTQRFIGIVYRFEVTAQLCPL